MAYLYDFSKEISGQYTFFNIGNGEQLDNDFLELINFSRIIIKRLTKIEEIDNNQNLFENLFKDYFKMFDYFELEDILNRYENYSSDYHRLGKLFIFYLGNFIYKDNVINYLNDELYIKMENFIKMDPVKYRDNYSKKVLEIIENRNKLRVENYIIYHAQPFLEKMEIMTDSLELDGKLNDTVEKLIADKNLQERIFEQNLVKDKKSEILSILFLNYLEKCVYYNSFRNQNNKRKNFIIQVENYVIYHMPNNYSLSEKQKDILEIVKRQVAKRLKEFIINETPKLDAMLNDFDEIEEFRKSGEIKVIEENDDISSLPIPYKQEEVKLALETYLKSIFINISNLENLLIFCKEYEEERDLSLEIALEYLSRFIYKISKDYKINDAFIITLENSIASCSDFHLTYASSKLCLAKSILLERVNRRNTLKNPKLTRNLECSKK